MKPWDFRCRNYHEHNKTTEETSDFRLAGGSHYCPGEHTQAMAHALLAAVNPVFGVYTLMLAIFKQPYTLWVVE